MTVVALGAQYAPAPAAFAAAATCGRQPATFVGTAGDDVIFGTAGNDVIAGLGGNDRLFGLDGDDVLCGGPGDDLLSGANGTDEIAFSESATPVVVDLRNGSVNGEGNDTLYQVENASGSNYDDRIFGDTQSNRLVGLGGNDLVAGDAGNDVLADGGTDRNATNTFVGGAGDDVYYGGVANDVADFYDVTGSAGSVGVNVDLAAGVARNQGNDLLSGIDGVKGTVARDVIVGNASPNTFDGRGGDDSIKGAGGDDVVDGGPGNDALDGQDGKDRVSFASATAAVNANLTYGMAIGDGNDTLGAFEGVIGGPLGDTIVGGAGDDTLDGAAGNDTIDGQGGRDLAAFDTATNPVVADLAAGTATGQGNDTLTRIENLRGGTQADLLRGNDSANTLVAGRNDTIEGRGGNDRFETTEPVGGSSSVTVSYVSAPGAVNVDLTNRTATGATGTDTFTFAPRSILGSSYDDKLACDAQSGDGCNVSGRGGNDTLSGTKSTDVFTGGGGNDKLLGNGSTDLANYQGNTAVNVNLVTGVATGQGTDTLSGIPAVQGSNANDTIVGGGGAGCTLWGGTGDDNLRASGAGCHIFGDAGNDTITGSAAPDRIEPGAGNDTVNAGGEGDTVWADDGDDRLDGGAGADLVTYATTAGTAVQANLGTGVVTGIGTDTVTSFEYFQSGNGNDTIRGTEAADTIYAAGGNDTVFGGGGDDRIYAATGDDWVDGNAGNDLVEPGAGADMMYGEDGADTVTYEFIGAPVQVDLTVSQATTASGTDRMIGVENVVGSAFDDLLRGNGDANVIDGKGGVDACDGNGGADVITNCP